MSTSIVELQKVDDDALLEYYQEHVKHSEDNLKIARYSIKVGGKSLFSDDKESLYWKFFKHIRPDLPVRDAVRLVFEDYDKEMNIKEITKLATIRTRRGCSQEYVRTYVNDLHKQGVIIKNHNPSEHCRNTWKRA